MSVSDLLAEVCADSGQHTCHYSRTTSLVDGSVDTQCQRPVQVKDLGEDFVFEDTDEGTDVWGHEQRLSAQSPSGVPAMHCLAWASPYAEAIHGMQKRPPPLT